LKVTAIVPAAGSSRRMKKGPRKPFLILGNKPILVRTLLKLQNSPHINEIVLVVNKRDLARSESLVKKFKLTKVITIMPGGKTRFESVQKGLCSIDQRTDLVFVHDGARPFLRKSIISEIIKEAMRFGSAVAARPATSTVKFVKKNLFIDFTPDRDKMWIIGTPQVFRKNILLKCYKTAGRSSKKIFDDSILAERLGNKVKVVLDSNKNIKITTPLDLTIAEAILKS